MTSKIALVLTALGVASNAMLCICADGHDLGGSDPAAAEHRHSHAQDSESNPLTHPHDSDQGESPSHSHGPGEECSCSGPGAEIVADSGTSVLIAADLALAPDLIIMDVEPPAPASLLLSGQAERGPPRPRNCPLFLSHHRLNL